MRREDHHYTAQQVHDHAHDALAMVEDLDPPSDLRAVVFTAVYEGLRSKSVSIIEPAPVAATLLQGVKGM